MNFLANISPREYQKTILETCKKQNTLVVLPTGVGKTLIALMLTVERMKKFPTEKILFLAPTKPLVEQHTNYFRKHLPELFADIQEFTGEVPASQRKKIWQTADIIFSTPQCIANDLKKKLYSLENVSLLIEDEAHRCLKNYSYRIIAELYKLQSNSPLILGLTASPGAEEEKIKDICKNLSIEALEVRTRDSDDVKPYLQDLEFTKISLDFPPEMQEIKMPLQKIFQGYVEELKNRNVLFGPANKVSLLELQRRLMFSISKGNKNFNNLLAVSSCAQAIKIQHALELLETQTLSTFHDYIEKLIKEANAAKSKGVQKLVSKPEFSLIIALTRNLVKIKFEHPKLAKIKEIIETEKQNNENIKIIIFAQYRDTGSVISKILNEIKGVTSKVFVGQAKKKNGKTGESTGLSQKEQKSLIEQFSEGKINILVATSIGEEGLDIPEVNAVIFYEPVPSAIRKIQRAGRTARLMPGKLITLVTKNTRDETHYWAAFRKEKNMHKAIGNIQNEIELGIFDASYTPEKSRKQKSLKDF